MKRAYALRTLRAGFVYVYYEGHLECFSVGTTRLKPDTQKNSGSIRANGDALIFPGDGQGEEAFIAFSEHEWTDNQCNKIVDNEGGCRDSEMQRFSLESPEADAFPLSQLANQVEEYAGLAGKYGWWSDYPSHGRYLADARISKLESSAGAQYVVALHDPVAITHDITSLVEEVLLHVQDYATENHRKKIIAETIETLYAQNPDDVEDLSEHVRETERATFLREYNDHIEGFQQQLIDYKSDRHAWLSTAASGDRPGTLGSAWAAYDFSSLEDWFVFEFSFVRSIGNLTTVAMPTEDLRKEPEFALLDRWASEPGSWLYKAVAPPDVMQNISSNWGLLGKVSSSSVSFVKDIHRNVQATQATQELTKILTAYAVKTGAAKRRGQLSPGHVENMGDMPDSLTKAFKGIGARNGFIVVVKDYNVESVLRSLEEASNQEGLVAEYVKAPKQRALDDAVQLFQLTDADGIYSVSKHPFRAGANTAGAGIISAFSILNLASASEALVNDLNGPSHTAARENQLALMGAIVGLGEAAAGALKVIDDALPPAARSRVVSRVAEKLTSRGATKLFGYVGLGFDLFASGTKSSKQFGQGEFDAGLLYAASGATSLAGFAGATVAGIVLSGGTALVAILVITVVSAVVSTLFDIWGDSEKAGPVEHWLDSSSWGKRKSLAYSTLEEEQEGLIRLIHEPVVIGPNFEIKPGFEHYLAEFQIFLPRHQQESFYELTDEYGGTVHANGPWEPKEHGVLIKYRDYIRKSSHDKYSMKYTAVYSPSKAFSKDPIIKKFSVEHLLA